MTNLVKCTGCNLIVDELLCYVQQKISIADEESLVRICASAFTSDEIKNSKTLLYEALSTEKRKVIRKNKGKEERDLSDIISLFKSTEPDDIPVFVARQLDKLPPILWDHLDCSKVLKDILIMKTEIENIKINYATTDSVQDLKVEVLRIRNDSMPPTSACKINTKRGSWLDSGPMGLSHEYINDSTNETRGIKSHLPQYRNMEVDGEKPRKYGEETFERQRSRSTQRKRASAGAAGEGSPRPREPAWPPAPEPPVSQPDSARVGTVIAQVTSSLRSPTAATPQVSSQQTAATNHLEFERHAWPLTDKHHNMTNENNDDGDGWQKVSHRKKNDKYRFMGKSGLARDMECSFRAAEKKIPMFITNVHSSTKECDIVQYIQKRTKETVSLEVINMRVLRGYKAYKFYILECNLPMYLDENLWPTGVIFRRFVGYRRTYKNQENNPVVGTNKTNNG